MSIIYKALRLGVAVLCYPVAFVAVALLRGGTVGEFHRHYWAGAREGGGGDDG